MNYFSIMRFFIQASSHIFLIIVSRQNWKNKMKRLTCLKPASFWIICKWGLVPCGVRAVHPWPPCLASALGWGRGSHWCHLSWSRPWAIGGLPSPAHCTWIGREPSGCHSPFPALSSTFSLILLSQILIWKTYKSFFYLACERLICGNWALYLGSVGKRSRGTYPSPWVSLASMWMVRTTVGRWCEGKRQERWFAQTWLEPPFKARLPVCSKVPSFPPSLSFLSPWPHPTATSWNKTWGAIPFQALFPTTLGPRQRLEPTGQMRPLERWMEHLAPVSTPPWEGVGCQLHRMDTCKLSRFLFILT